MSCRIRTTLFSVLVAALTNLLIPAAHALPSPELGLAARAAHLHAIERIRQEHRAWPEANRSSPASLDSRVGPDFFLDRAADTVRKSQALERFWNRPLTSQQLQAELDRMARTSKQPERLAELWGALADDPFLIAEMLARPILADRLIREWYAHDERFHGELEEQVRTELAAAPSAGGLHRLGGVYRELELTPETVSGRRSVDAEAWRLRREQLAARFGASVGSLTAGMVSGLREDGGRFYVLGILEISEEHIRLASVEWAKRPFESWWAEVRPQLSADAELPMHAYDLPRLGGEPCVDDSWRPTLAIPDPRYEHTAVWTGTEMIVWGGMSSVGNFPDQQGRYEPATDSWSVVSPVGAPGLRSEHTAVWTGTEMIVWGGAGVAPGNTGGRYDPLTDTWTPTSLGGAPSARWSHVAVWTGTEMIVWGGDSGSGSVRSGGRYDPLSDTWTATSLVSAPTGREIASVVWTGTEMIVWGGFSDPFTLDTGGRYDPATDSWRATSLVNVPSFRHFHTAVWTGEEMIVWGGVGEGFGTTTGGRYDPATDSWQATSTAGAPSPRWLHEAIWTGEEMLIWGGTVLLAPHPTSGGRYDPRTDSWAPVSQLNVPEGREDAASVWTGTEMIVWGGLGDDYFVNSGGRYDPAADTWLPTQTYNVPSARGLHTAAWTGSEMMIYGGDFLGEPGALYEPATDSWRAASPLNAPTGIQNMTSVWTGSEVIVWGGFPETNSGGRYDPLTDTWAATSRTGAPVPRYWHSAVWTGSEMIVWGGWPTVNTGGRYDPTTDRWTPTSTAGAPSPRDSHVGVWTGSEMIIWSGYPETTAGRNGGRYDPATDSWSPMSTVDSPDRRSDASVVWTGSEVIVWGGQSFQDFLAYNSGGRYDPATDTWRPTETVGAPSPRVTPAVWSGNEMVVWGGDLLAPTGGRYNPLGDNWVSTSQVGAPHGRWNTTLVWTGDEMIAWGGIIETATGGLYCARLEGNQVPIARDDEYSMVAGARLRISQPGVLANDTDGNGDTLRARVADQPANGILTFRSNGSFMYRPNVGFAGVDEFTYTASDGRATSPPATVTIEVECVTNCLRSVTIVIDLLIGSTRSRIWVEDETGAPAADATVTATWTVPGGERITQSAVTDGTGQATLTIADGRSGTFFIEVDGIEKAGFTFDPVNSVLVHGATR